MVKQLVFILSILMIFNSCADQKLMLEKKILSSSLKIDGFYYVEKTEYKNGEKGSIYYFTFYYRDGTFLTHFKTSTLEEEKLRESIASQYDILRKDKINWGIYEVSANQFVREGWNTSVGGGLPRTRAEGYIKNDSTIVFTKSMSFDSRSFPKERKDYVIENHYYPYFPKPDSLNPFTHRKNKN